MIERHQNLPSTRPVPPAVRNGTQTSLKKPTSPKPGAANAVKEWFRRFAHKTAVAVGSAWSFLVAFAIIVLWASTGPLFHYSDTWQLVINTATTIITFLMVFLIQNTQNRDARAIHLKLDELLHAVKGARNRMINLEQLSEEEMDKLQKDFERLRKKAAPLPCEEEKSNPAQNNPRPPGGNATEGKNVSAP